MSNTMQAEALPDHNLPQESAYPENGTEAERWRFLIRYAGLAPSERNTQPWLFRINGDQRSLYVDLYADRSRAVRQVDPDDRELILSCGGALYHLRLALRRFGYAGDVTLFPEGTNCDLLARLRFGAHAEPTPEERLLFATAHERHTSRAPFTEQPVPPALLTALQRVAGYEHVRLRSLQDEAERRLAADLVTEANLRLFARPEFRQELSQWLHADSVHAPDGIPGQTFGLAGQAGSHTDGEFGTDADVANYIARNHELALQAPLLLILDTPQDMPIDWLRAGEALTALLLRAYADGLRVSFLNAPVQVGEIRARLGQELHFSGYPQVILRLGYGPNSEHPTQRRDVGDTLLNERPISGL
jgi:hypothetical protein